MEINLEEDKKIIHNFTEDNFEIIIEMPSINSTREKRYIDYI